MILSLCIKRRIHCEKIQKQKPNYMVAANKEYKKIEITEEMDFSVWGVVTYVSTKQDSYIAIDCNNFYASCERVFNPALNNKPVIVLSNNDGCVIARSQK